MIYFNSDYLEGAHPSIMVRLAETNMVQTVGYGEDEYCEAAREKIKTACQAPEADVHFLVGGTQTNTTVIAAILRPWQGVISAVSGHINCHEAGAIESTGHKVITLPTTNGKLTALYDICRRYGLPLFIDGARLGYGLMAEESDMTLPEIARLCDVFYIGGTKVGALFGEAVVIMNENLKKDFRFIMKQRGGRMAKGRLLGVQFDTLFTNDLYFKISRHAIEMAHQIRDIFVSAGYPLLFDSPTNQQYPIMSDDELAILGKSFGYEYWERVDETHSGVRFCASWATKQEHVDALRAAVNALKK